MAWNEPGGSGGKDPWGNRNDEQGPPDLDEIVRKLQQRFGGLFGGSGGGNAPSGGGMGLGGLAGLFGVAALVWALSGIYIVDEGTRGVVLQFGAYKETTMPGPHWYPRFVQSVERINVENVRNIDLGLRTEDALMLTQDENIIDIKFTVQYKIKDARDYLFNVSDPDETLRQATESAVREVIGKNKMDFIITGGRSEVVARSQTLLQNILDGYQTGLVVTRLNMQDAQPPEQVQSAFADAVKAREDEERFKNEAEAYSNDVIPKARGQAARLIEEANAYKQSVIAEAEGETARFLQVLAEYEKAPNVTRKRLYLDTMESVLGNTSKVIVDSEGGNNLLYLPLDKLMQRGELSMNNQAGSQRFSADTTSNEPRTSTRLRDNLRRREVR